MVFRAIILKRGYAWSALMICFDFELFPQNFVWQLNNDQKSLEPHRNCQIKSSKWLYFSFHMSQRIDNIQFFSYESIFLTNFKCSKHFALKKSSELWNSSSSRKGRPRIAAFQYYNSKDYELNHRWRATSKNKWWIRHQWPLWQYGLWSFQTGYAKLERFLHKNQHTQRKSLKIGPTG